MHMSQAEVSEWRIAVKGEQRGPYTLDQMRAMIAEGRLPPDTLVWKPGMANWAPIGSVADLTAPVSRGPMPVPVTGPASPPSGFGEILTFRRMITPTIIQIIFWLGVVGCLISALGMMVSLPMGMGVIPGLLILVFGTLGVRIWCELIILAFRIYDVLNEIKDQRK